VNGDEQTGNSGNNRNDKPVSASAEQPPSETPEQDNKPQGGNSRGRRLFRHFGKPIGAAVLWLDEHDGLTTALATAVMAIFTGLLAQYAKDQGAITERQLSIMERQIDAAERPWVSLQFAPIGDLVFDKDSGEIRIKITLKNTGHSPAVGINFEAEGYFPHTVQDILKRQNEICGRRYGATQFGNTVFPGETASFETNALFLEEDIKKGKEPFKDIGLFRNPTIGICVAYKFPFGPPGEGPAFFTEAHHTGAAWQLFRKPNGTILPEKTVPLTQILTNERSHLSIGEQAN